MPAESTTSAANGVEGFAPGFGLHLFAAGTRMAAALGHPLYRLVLPPNLVWAALLGTLQRELTAVADDPTGRVSMTAPLEALTQLGRTIGQTDAVDSAAPLARAAARHAAAAQALRAARATRGTTRDQALRRLELLEELDRLRARQAQLRAELERGTLAARARTLEEARALASTLSETTQRCFSLSSYREFPLDQQAALQRADRRAAEAHDAYESACAALDEIEEKLASEQARLDNANGEWLRPLEEDWEARLAESDERVAQAQCAVDAATVQRDEVRQRLEDAERALRHLPDFGQFAGDPMEWINQITTTFATHARMRNAERAVLEELRSALEARESVLSGTRRLFLEGEAGILARARGYHQTGEGAAESAVHLAEEERSLQSIYREVDASVPGFRGMAALMAVAAPALAFITYATRNPGLIYALGGVVMALAFFLFSFARARRALTRIRLRLNQIGPEAERARALASESRANLAGLLREAGVETLRELEAMYERYSEDKSAAEALSCEFAEQEAKTEEAERHTAALFASLRQTFEGVGEDIVAEGDVTASAQRALSTYQQYRDAKRRRAESRDLLQRREREREEAESALESATQEDVRLSLQARDQLRRAGFSDERRHAGALHAFRAYRLRHAQQKTRHGRMELMEERRRVLGARVESTRRERDDAAKTLERLLAKAGVETVDGWLERAEHAREYREAWTARTRLQEELDALLAGESLERLSEEIAAAGKNAAAFDRSPETIQSELESVSGAIEEALEEAESLNRRMDRGGAVTSLNELEEDEAVAREALALLTAERRAVAHAAAGIQEAARNRRAALAVRLAPSATEWLQRLTGRTDASIALSSDLAVRVEGAMPHAGLILLAIRLAVLEVLPTLGEPAAFLVEGEVRLDVESAYGIALDALALAGELRPVVWCAGPSAWAEVARGRGLTVRELA